MTSGAKVHREIGVFIINNIGQVLFQRRSANKKSHPNKLALCHGHVEVGESFEKAALREIKEELGIDVDISELHFVKRYESENGHICFYYVKRDLLESDFSIQLEELSEVKWIDIDEAISMIRNHDDEIIYRENRLELFENIKKKEL